MISHNRNYEDFCRRICGGYIERQDPREEPNTSFTKYQSLISALYQGDNFNNQTNTSSKLGNCIMIILFAISLKFRSNQTISQPLAKVLIKRGVFDRL